MSSYTISESQTFTVTNARYIASKVVTDLMRLQRKQPVNRTGSGYPLATPDPTR